MGTQPQLERLVIGISGRIGSGKTTVGKYLESKYGFQYLRYSAVLAEWRQPQSQGKAQLQKIGWEVMAGGMQTELNQRLISQVLPGKNAAIDGLRHPIDYDSLVAAFGPSYRLVYVDCATEQRWNHLKGPNRYADRAAFDKADSEPVEQNIELLRSKAQCVIRNEDTLRGLYGHIDSVVSGFWERIPK